MQRNVSVGILGTVACHLFVLVLFLAVKLGNLKSDKKELIEIEFKQEEFKPEDQKLERKFILEDMAELSKQAMGNAASNMAMDKLSKELSTLDYEQQLKNELGFKELEPKYEQTEKNNYENIERPEPPKKEEKKKDNIYNFGPSRVSYELSDKRSARYIERPIYKCQGGGVVIVKIVIDQEGNVLESRIGSAGTNDECLVNAALISANSSLFQSNFKSPKRVEGVITYMFVAQ